MVARDSSTISRDLTIFAMARVHGQSPFFNGCASARPSSSNISDTGFFDTGLLVLSFFWHGFVGIILRGTRHRVVSGWTFGNWRHQKGRRMMFWGHYWFVKINGDYKIYYNSRWAVCKTVLSVSYLQSIHLREHLWTRVLTYASGIYSRALRGNC